MWGSKLYLFSCEKIKQPPLLTSPKGRDKDKKELNIHAKVTNEDE
jgi:hypothetical protein